MVVAYAPLVRALDAIRAPHTAGQNSSAPELASLTGVSRPVRNEYARMSQPYILRSSCGVGRPDGRRRVQREYTASVPPCPSGPRSTSNGAGRGATGTARVAPPERSISRHAPIAAS